MDMKKELNYMREQIEQVENEEKSLAMELLQDCKRQNKRNFIIILVLIFALIGSNLGWLIYESQFETVAETTTLKQYQEEIDNSTMSGVIK